MKELSVDDDNPFYKSIDGALLSKNGKQLIKYPEGKKGSYYVVPESVNWLGNCAITNNSIRKILLPDISILHTSSIRIKGAVDIYIKEEHPENIELRKEWWFDKDEDYISVGQGSTLYVPIGTGYAYRHHPAFSCFERVVPINFNKLNQKEVFGDCSTDDEVSDVCEKDFNQ